MKLTGLKSLPKRTETRPTLIQKTSLLFALVWLSTSLACTNDRRPLNVATSVTAKTSGLQNTSTNSQTCTNEDLLSFEKPTGEIVDLSREVLPKGLYLATLSEVFLEKKVDGLPTVKFVAREVPGSRNGEIICAENLEKVGPDFDLAIMGLVKFETTKNPNGENFTARQFYVFSDRGGYGVILSNPEVVSKDQDLKRFLNSGMSRGQLVRLSDRDYVLRMIRERDGVRVRLAIRLELVPALN